MESLFSSGSRLCESHKPASPLVPPGHPGGGPGMINEQDGKIRAVGSNSYPAPATENFNE